MNDTVDVVENVHLRILVADVMDEAWRRLEVNRLVEEVNNCDDIIRQRVEMILSTKRGTRTPGSSRERGS